MGRRRLTVRKARRRIRRRGGNRGETRELKLPKMAKFTFSLRLTFLCSFMLSQAGARSKHFLIETKDGKEDKSTAKGTYLRKSEFSSVELDSYGLPIYDGDDDCFDVKKENGEILTIYGEDIAWRPASQLPTVARKAFEDCEKRGKNRLCEVDTSIDCEDAPVTPLRSGEQNF